LFVEKEGILSRYLIDFQLKCLIKGRVLEITLTSRDSWRKFGQGANHNEEEGRATLKRDNLCQVVLEPPFSFFEMDSFMR
jgi:hypothetical protein